MIKFKALMVVVALLHLSSFFLMLWNVEPFYTFFYQLGWWSYIIFIAALNHLQARNSLIFDHPRKFLRVFIYSSLIWFFFEAYNFRLENWHYYGVPIEAWIRIPGYFIAFGTVLPGIFETSTLVANNFLASRLKGPAIRLHRAVLYRFLLIGGLMMVAPLVSPAVFFPFVWVGLIFLLDAVLHFMGAGSVTFSAKLSAGDYTEVASFAAAGLLCGFLWEFWNFWAGAKWMYSIPMLDYLHLFEMPILGYLGFPFFALECYLLYYFLELTWQRVVRRSPITPILVIVLAAMFIGAVISGIEEQTIVTYKILLAGS